MRAATTRGSWWVVAVQNVAGYPAAERDQLQGGRVRVQQEVGTHADVAEYLLHSALTEPKPRLVVAFGAIETWLEGDE